MIQLLSSNKSLTTICIEIRKIRKMEYKHFSHDHHLNLYQSQPGQNLLCHGCQTPISDSSSIYACWTCKFFLHDHCGNANRFIKHPSHPAHPLILIPTPTYCSGAFICNACGSLGKSFSYSCPTCEIDLHLNCAFLPPKITHNSHPHDLVISPNLPKKKDGMVYVCKVCDKRMGDKNWNYCCVGCDFRLHTFCATNEVKPGLYVDDEDPDSVSVNRDDEQVIELTEEEVIQLYKIQILTQMMSNANINANV
ncbi:uncharacterized protein LOC124940553 [Impatiens glandulifera]|uniref:uncharacterized protein LOC124940553 n=1 Tax=Impatiens glandulifera TaxID=253017 RepID=UPI001FB13C77|nr:uncharacterized protein LOC124940553 [Impatiens glandulifera]